MNIQMFMLVLQAVSVTTALLKVLLEIWKEYSRYWMTDRSLKKKD